MGALSGFNGMSTHIDNDFQLEVAEDLHEEVPLPVPELSPRYVYKPPPPPKPLLPNNRPLAREALQPARLAALRAAPVPLIEATQPLLDVLAAMPPALAVEQIDALHRQLVREVANFQSVCVEAHIREGDIIGASYVLCTAIDEAVGRRAVRGDADQVVGTWASHSLAALFHGDTEGGVKVFELLGHLLARPSAYIDLIELIHRILGLGFEGNYGGSARNLRTLEDIRHKTGEIVRTVRNELAEELALSERRKAPAIIVDTPHPWSDERIALLWVIGEWVVFAICTWVAWHVFL